MENSRRARRSQRTQSRPPTSKPPLRLVAPGPDAAYDDDETVADAAPRRSAPIATAHAALVPLSVVSCVALYYLGHWPLAWVVAAAAPFTALFIAAPYLARVSMTRFDRDVVGLLAKKSPGALEARYRSALAMRLFAAPVLVAERAGLVAWESGRAAKARHAYKEALDAYGSHAPANVLVGYAHACHAVGDDREAVRAYEQVLKSVGGIPRVHRNLAHALARTADEPREALRVADAALERCADEVLGAELRLVKAIAHARLGDPLRARKLLREVEGREGGEIASLREEVERRLEDADAA